MEKKIVVFFLQNEEFAFDIMKVVEIIRHKSITNVPTAPAFIEGVINLRGRIIPVIDLRKRFKLADAEREKDSRVIIVELKKKQLVGVIVDRVSHVLAVKEEEVLPAPSSIVSVGGKYIESIVQRGERIIVFLNIEKVFSDEEQDEINYIAEKEGGEFEESPYS
ncbi:MAG TPA: chemotaxis protein CheW [Firmicutes bacterium]|nr:chemotaxis protein CheW [Bacillota bacterium]